MAGSLHSFSDAELVALGQGFGLAGVDSLVWAPFGDSGAMRLVRVGGRELVAKRHWMLSGDRAALLGAVLDAAQAAGVAPPILRTVAGGLVLELGGAWYGLMERVQGEPPACGRGLGRAGCAVARLHLALAQVPGQAVCPRAVAPDEAALLLARAGCDDLGREVRAAAEASAAMPRQLVHRDLHAGNFLLRDNSALVLDFDSFSTGARVADALFAAFRLAAGEVAGMARFLKAYEADVPLSAKERTHGLLALACDFLLKLAFIQRRREAGETLFEKDRRNYESFALRALDLARRYPGGLEQLQGMA